MIPQSFVPVLETTELPSDTWRLSENSVSSDRISGLEAVRQAVYLRLNTERRRYLIYSWNYGIELDDLFGQPLSFVRPELERRIREALVQDTRITGVDGFVFNSKGKTLHLSFTVRSIFGDFKGEKNV